MMPPMIRAQEAPLSFAGRLLFIGRVVGVLAAALLLLLRVQRGEDIAGCKTHCLSRNCSGPWPGEAMLSRSSAHRDSLAVYLAYLLDLRATVPSARLTIAPMSRQCTGRSSAWRLATPDCSLCRLKSRSAHFRSCWRRASQQRARCNAGRLDVQAVIPQLQGDATEQTPPDLPSFLFKERIVYLGMSLVPAVTELMLAELMYLQYDSPTKPILMYINSAGVQKGAETLGYEFEALAIYDLMRYVKPPIYTLCVGNAFGEAAMLLSAGQKGKRAALPSATIMLRQPMSRLLQMQATDIDIRRNEVRKTKENIVRLLSKCTGQPTDKLEREISRPRYFNPYEAIDYGIIDKVLEPESDEQRKIAKVGTIR